MGENAEKWLMSVLQLKYFKKGGCNAAQTATAWSWLRGMCKNRGGIFAYTTTCALQWSLLLCAWKLVQCADLMAWCQNIPSNGSCLPRCFGCVQCSFKNQVVFFSLSFNIVADSLEGWNSNQPISRCRTICFLSAGVWSCCFPTTFQVSVWASTGKF